MEPKTSLAYLGVLGLSRKCDKESSRKNKGSSIENYHRESFLVSLNSAVIGRKVFDGNSKIEGMEKFRDVKSLERECELTCIPNEEFCPPNSEKSLLLAHLSSMVGGNIDINPKSDRICKNTADIKVLEPKPKPMQTPKTELRSSATSTEYHGKESLFLLPLNPGNDNKIDVHPGVNEIVEHLDHIVAPEANGELNGTPKMELPQKFDSSRNDQSCVSLLLNKTENTSLEMGTTPQDVELGGSNPQPSPAKNERKYWYLNKTTATILTIQSIYCVLFTAFIRYSPEADGSEMRNSIHPVRGGFTHEDLPSKTAALFLPILYMHILVSTKTTPSPNTKKLSDFFLLFTMGIEETILLLAFSREQNIRFTISIDTIVEAECLMLASTIWFLILDGRTSLLQIILLLQIFEIPVQILTKYLLDHYLKVNDCGLSMLGHLFGSLYGFSALFGLEKRNIANLATKEAKFNYSVALILLTTLPNLAYVRTSNDAQRRVVIHSVLVMTSSFAIGLPVSSIFDKGRKFSYRKILDGMIGAGAGMASVSHLMFDVYGSILVGIAITVIVIAVISVLEDRYPQLDKRDVIQVLIRHGLTGFIGGILSSFLATFASSDIGYYGYSLFKIYPARAPVDGSDDLLEVQSYLPLPAGDGRTALQQGGFQLAGVLVVVVNSCVGGLISGCLLRFKIFEGTVEGVEDSSIVKISPSTE